MAITASQKKKIVQTLNVFETGSKDGNYSQISLYKDGPGDIKQITYGRSQTTEFGHLKTMLQEYVAAGGIEANNIRPYLARMGKTPSLCTETPLLNALKRAGKDPIMITTQDKIFDLLYYIPAYNWFVSLGFTKALSLLVIYDSFIHSGSVLGFLRERFTEHTPSNGGNENVWIKQYVDTRYKWLANHPRKVLRETLYRPNCFKACIKADNWDLTLAFKANGTVIN